MPNTKRAASEIIELLGGPSRAAEKLGITNPSVVCNWRDRDSIPADRALAIEKLTGIPASEIRPDVFTPPTKTEARVTA